MSGWFHNWKKLKRNLISTKGIAFSANSSYLKVCLKLKLPKYILWFYCKQTNALCCNLLLLHFQFYSEIIFCLLKTFFLFYLFCLCEYLRKFICSHKEIRNEPNPFLEREWTQKENVIKKIQMLFMECEPFIYKHPFTWLDSL